MEFTLSDRGTQYHSITRDNKRTVPAAQLEALEDLDLIYRTLCAVLFNYVPTSGHPGGSISSGRIAEALVVSTAAYDFKEPDTPSADIVAYAAGHKAMGLYALWACRNELVRIARPDLLPSVPNQLRVEDLLGFRKNRTTTTPLFVEHHAKPLDGHPTPFVPFVPLSTGASGVGMAASIGLAFGLKDLYGDNAPIVHAIEGEGGLTAGRVHEAIAAAASSGIDNFVCHVDWNQASIEASRVCREGVEPGQYVQWSPVELFMLHGFNVVEVADGKDFEQILAAQAKALELKSTAPTAIVYHTVKGWQYGIEGMKSHGAGHAFCSEDYYKALTPFEERFGLAFPRFEGDKTPDRVEESFFASLMAVRAAFEKSAEMTRILGGFVAERGTALAAMRRRVREDAPCLDRLFQEDVSPQERPSLCSYAPGKSYTLRAALGDVLRHLNGMTGGAILSSAADLYGSTSIATANADFAPGYYHAHLNPRSRLLSLGGIAEDGMGGIIAGISTVGGHIGAGSSYGAFIAPLHNIAARLHIIGLQGRSERNPRLPWTPFISVNGHAGVKTGEDGPTHAEPNCLQIFQGGFPGQSAITLTPWEPMELWPLMVAALKKRPAVIAPFVTRPNETVLDRAALGLAPAEACVTGVYKLLSASGKPDGVVVYQGSEVAYAFAEQVLPLLRAKGIDLDVYYVSSAELFDSLDEATRRSLFPAAAAESAMGITGFTMPTMCRWVTSERGRAHTLHPFMKGRYLGSGMADKVMEEAGLDGESQFKAIVRFLG